MCAADSPPWQRRGEGWFGQFPEQFCVVVDRPPLTPPLPRGESEADPSYAGCLSQLDTPSINKFITRFPPCESCWVDPILEESYVEERVNSQERGFRAEFPCLRRRVGADLRSSGRTLYCCGADE